MLFKLLSILQFNYSPLVWICHGKDLNNEISDLHAQELRIIY